MEKSKLSRVQICKGETGKVEAYFHHWFSKKNNDRFQLVGVVELVNGKIECYPSSQIEFYK